MFRRTRGIGDRTKSRESKSKNKTKTEGAVNNPSGDRKARARAEPRIDWFAARWRARRAEHGDWLLARYHLNCRRLHSSTHSIYSRLVAEIVAVRIQGFAEERPKDPLFFSAFVWFFVVTRLCSLEVYRFTARPARSPGRDPLSFQTLRDALR